MYLAGSRKSLGLTGASLSASNLLRLAPILHNTDKELSLRACVQTAQGCLSQAVVGSEIAAMMIMAVLPDMQKHYLAEGAFKFAMRCRHYELRHRLPLGSVQYPFPLFFDNDRRHAHARVSMAMWWQRHEQALPLQRCTAQSLHALDAQYVEPLVAQLRTREAALPVTTRKSDNELKAVAYATLQTSGLQGPGQRAAELHSLQRALNEQLAHSVGFPPQLCGPLVDKTPDINSPAENCVGFFKTHVNNKVREWMTQWHMQDALDWGKTYASALWEKLKQLNTADGRLTCHASVLKAVARVRLLAAKEDQVVLVQQVNIRKAPDGKRYISSFTRMELGRNGRWMAKGVFKG